MSQKHCIAYEMLILVAWVLYLFLNSRFYRSSFFPVLVLWRRIIVIGNYIWKYMYMYAKPCFIDCYMYSIIIGNDFSLSLSLSKVGKINCVLTIEPTATWHSSRHIPEVDNTRRRKRPFKYSNKYVYVHKKIMSYLYSTMFTIKRSSFYQVTYK